MVDPTRGFLLSIDWRDAPEGLELRLWAASEEGPLCATLTRQEAVMFVERGVEARAARRAEVSLQTLQGTPVDALYFRTQRALIDERDRLRALGRSTYESDLKPSSRFAMERFLRGDVFFEGPSVHRDSVRLFKNPVVTAAPAGTVDFRVLSIDIETDGWDGPVLSVALVGPSSEHVLMVGSQPSDDPRLRFFGSERALLVAAFEAIRREDPDVIVGWNVVDFDLRCLEQRSAAYQLPFAVGRHRSLARVHGERSSQSAPRAQVPGRVVVDGVGALKNASMAFERYTLDFVAQAVLGRGKRIDSTKDTLTEIRRMWKEAPFELSAYNLEDARLARDVLKKTRLLEFLIARERLTGLMLDRLGGSVAAFDALYLPRLHRKGLVAGDVGMASNASPSPGGHVLEGVPGFARNVVSFDFRSLYPSIIRTFQIDPFGLARPGADPIPGFAGASFARNGAILPEILSVLHEARTKARIAKDETLSTAIKILMNSFYGVLGTPGSRFFDSRLASSITLRGHEIIERTRQFFEERGLRVLYGDTDSLFVELGSTLSEREAARVGEGWAAQVNEWWQETLRREHGLSSFLELRMDTYFPRFLMPTLRGSERGSKKRYAGLAMAPDGKRSVVVRGLEAVRTDWTPLAREAQRELLQRVFDEEPWQEWLVALSQDVSEGRVSVDRLTYRKRLRRPVEAYDSVAPHVKAALLMTQEDEEQPVAEVEYVMTTHGPQPLRQRSAPVDFDHYLEKQLAPALDVVLQALGTSFARVAGRQLDLFDRAPEVL